MNVKESVKLVCLWLSLPLHAKEEIIRKLGLNENDIFMSAKEDKKVCKRFENMMKEKSC